MKNNNNIRQATKKDFKRLKEIGMACYDITVDPKQKNFIARFLFQRYFSKSKFKERERLDVLIYGIEENNQMVGFYELEREGCLSSLYVHPNFHKKGYGKILLFHALKKAKERNLKEVYLDSSFYAHDFYKRFGFKDSKKPRVILGVWMVAMKIKID